MSIVKKLIALIFLTFLITSCGHSAGDVKDGDPDLKKMHIDANLYFAMALPASWEEVDREDGSGTDAPSMTWRSKEQNDVGQPDILLRVVSIPPEAAKGGLDRLKNDFFAKRPDIQEISSTGAEINELPARRVVGHFADRKTLIVFITAYLRAFTLEFTTHTGEFDAYSPLFEEILKSFHVL